MDRANWIWRHNLRKALSGCRTVLDVGCGCSSTLRDLGVPYPVGIDLYETSIRQARERGTHRELFCGDIRDLPRYFRPRQFEACVALDVIEHLNEAEGYRLLEQMEEIACRRVAIFTPVGFLPQNHREAGDFQEHLSGWKPEQLRDRGYTVIGCLGWKRLRGEGHALRQPKNVCGWMAYFTHVIWTRNFPGSAAAMPCIKRLN